MRRVVDDAVRLFGVALRRVVPARRAAAERTAVPAGRLAAGRRLVLGLFLKNPAIPLPFFNTVRAREMRCPLVLPAPAARALR